MKPNMKSDSERVKQLLVELADADAKFKALKHREGNLQDELEEQDAQIEAFYQYMIASVNVVAALMRRPALQENRWWERYDEK